MMGLRGLSRVVSFYNPRRGHIMSNMVIGGAGVSATPSFSKCFAETTTESYCIGAGFQRLGLLEALPLLVLLASPK